MKKPAFLLITLIILLLTLVKNTKKELDATSAKAAMKKTL